MAERLLGLHGQAALQAHLDHAAALQPRDDAPLPDYVANFLVQLRLARNVPFGYLVPDQALLPSESVRFFMVDEGWFDAAMSGALAVGTANTRDTEHVARSLPAVQTAVRAAVPLAAGLRRGTVTRRALALTVNAAISTAGAPPDPGGTAPVTGMLLRSSLVSGWPGFAVRAFTTTDISFQADPSAVPAGQCVPLLRMELLSPSVLIVLFAGVPALVWIEEPHHGIQLGVDDDNGTGVISPVNPDGSAPDPPRPPVTVPLRAASGPKVIDIGSLAAQLGVTSPADLAVQLLRPPYRQRFATQAAGPRP
jgi:hypothetical protein